MICSVRGPRSMTHSRPCFSVLATNVSKVRYLIQLDRTPLLARCPQRGLARRGGDAVLRRNSQLLRESDYTCPADASQSKAEILPAHRNLILIKTLIPARH